VIGRDTQHGLTMLHRILEQFIPFAFWYAAWHLADLIFKLH